MPDRQDRAFSGRLNHCNAIQYSPPERKIAAGKVNTTPSGCWLPFYAVTHRRPPPRPCYRRREDVCCGDRHPNITARPIDTAAVICAAMPCAYVSRAYQSSHRWSSLHDASQSWANAERQCYRHDDPHRSVLNGLNISLRSFFSRFWSSLLTPAVSPASRRYQRCTA